MGNAQQEPDSTAIHEAGHAVLQHALGVGVRHVTIVPNFDEQYAGASTHGGEWGEDVENLRITAEDAFWLRHAIGMLAGAEAQRHLRPDYDAGLREAGAESDYHAARDALLRISEDSETFNLYWSLARRRSQVLVEHYAAEIAAVAAALIQHHEITGEDVQRIFCESLLARRGARLSW